MEMGTNNTKPILVTGASGYIASYIIKDLLEAGRKVRGTVRSLANIKKYDHLTSLPQSKELLELFEADLNN
jgi:nucleoside-diphosphate-sugar epimerase